MRRVVGTPGLRRDGAGSDGIPRSVAPADAEGLKSTGSPPAGCSTPQKWLADTVRPGRERTSRPRSSRSWGTGRSPLRPWSSLVPYDGPGERPCVAPRRSRTTPWCCTVAATPMAAEPPGSRAREGCGRLDRCTPFAARTRCAAWPTRSSTCWSSAAASPAPAWPSTRPAGACKTALVEKDDFASGTSSKSSKMVHGGLRYLQQREFRLVYENLAERQRLLDNAPHLVSPAALPHPALRARRRRLQDGGPLVLHRAVALRPHRRAAHRRRGTSEVTKDEALAHLPDAQHRPPGGRLPLLRRPGRRRPPDAHPGPHGGPRLTAPWWPTTRRSSASPTGDDGTADRRRRAPDADDEASRVRRPGPGRGQRHRRLGRRRAGPRRGHAPPLDPAGQGRPRHRAGRPAALRHRRRHPGAQGPALDLRGVVARDRPRLPRHDRHRLPRARSTIRPARPRTSTTCSTRPTTSPRRASPGPTSPASGPACGPCWRPEKGGHVSERTADLSRRHTVRTSSHGVVTVTGGKLTTYRKMAQDTVDAVVHAARRVAQAGGAASPRRLAAASAPPTKTP